MFLAAPNVFNETSQDQEHMPIILIIFLNIIRGYKFDFNRGLIASGASAWVVCRAAREG